MTESSSPVQGARPSTTVRIMQRRAKTGEEQGWRDCEPTATPGVFLYPSPVPCDACDEDGLSADQCAVECADRGAPFVAWWVICQAGVLCSGFPETRPVAERLAAGLMGLGVDFTAPFEVVTEAAKDPAVQAKANEVRKAAWAPLLHHDPTPRGSHEPCTWLDEDACPTHGRDS